jgi:hypothetical protein
LCPKAEKDRAGFSFNEEKRKENNERTFLKAQIVALKYYGATLKLYYKTLMLN